MGEKKGLTKAEFKAKYMPTDSYFSSAEGLLEAVQEFTEDIDNLEIETFTAAQAEMIIHSLLHFQKTELQNIKPEQYEPALVTIVLLVNRFDKIRKEGR